MCGLVAVLKPCKTSSNQLKREVKSSLDLIKHRGPDGSNIWINSDLRVGLGHVRLAIVDLESGSQPMALDDGTTIAFNGEIYNYIELRKELGLDSFKTTSDTEVILKSYKRWGENCVDHLRGMFAFVIWDAAKQKMFFARDRFGIKPLYWLNGQDGSIYFASEIKALLPFVVNKTFVMCVCWLSDTIFDKNSNPAKKISNSGTCQHNGEESLDRIIIEKGTYLQW